MRSLELTLEFPQVTERVIELRHLLGGLAAHKDMNEPDARYNQIEPGTLQRPDSVRTEYTCRIWEEFVLKWAQCPWWCTVLECRML